MTLFALLAYVGVAACMVIQAMSDEDSTDHTAAIVFSSVLWAPMLLGAITLVAIDAAAARHRR